VCGKGVCGDGDGDGDNGDYGSDGDCDGSDAYT
jgi:hypothetical protein